MDPNFPFFLALKYVCYNYYLWYIVQLLQNVSLQEMALKIPQNK